MKWTNYSTSSNLEYKKMYSYNLYYVRLHFFHNSFLKKTTER